jgi:glycosyltransferase involved in cell wall biosynthesis
MTVAATIAVYNEAKNIKRLLNSLINQSYYLNEIVIVDDGSTDTTGAIIKSVQAYDPRIKYIYQKNAGPAIARNKAWRACNAEICLFTDGDCVPERDWAEKLVAGFTNKKIGATAGTYITLNAENRLAYMIGREISWRYKDVGLTVQAHGTYNLGVRREILCEINGFNENFPKPSGEDWDLTYKISSKYQIHFIREARVGTFHDTKLMPYLKMQLRRAYDRIRIYNDHPEHASGDNYTGNRVKYDIVATSTIAVMFLLIPFYPILTISIILIILLYLLVSTSNFLLYIGKTKPELVWFVFFICIIRNFFWGVGLLKGLFDFGGIKIIKGLFIKEKVNHETITK